MAETIETFANDETAATAVEYGLIVGLIALALVASFMLVGNSLSNLMDAGIGQATRTIAEQAGKID